MTRKGERCEVWLRARLPKSITSSVPRVPGHLMITLASSTPFSSPPEPARVLFHHPDQTKQSLRIPPIHRSQFPLELISLELIFLELLGASSLRVHLPVSNSSVTLSASRSAFNGISYILKKHESKAGSAPPPAYPCT